MEQKQLDDMENSFFGEEFIDEEPALERLNREDKKEGKSKKEMMSKKAKPAKKAAAKIIDHTEDAKKSTFKMGEIKMEKEKDIEITAAKAPLETTPPVDPWASEKEEGSGFFKDASTWKAITGIMVILLILSVLTQGFRFSDAALTGAATASLTSSEAESKVVEYVNTNLLRAPFTATANSVEESENLYKVSLDVAGQTIDSYLTKNGKLFFPQGFDTSKTVETQLEERKSSNGSLTLPSESEPDAIESPAGTTKPAPSSVAPEGADIKIIPLQAKKWLFLPNQVTVNQRDIIQLSITPSTSPSLALAKFTFAIPELGVEEEIDGPTIVQFTAEKKGHFKFTCSSCEEWRGMIGYLNVK